ncbi:hypothetical protein V496_08581 [Pseudogymnoascus sp. VKM F-4515 (FW-2607)]|nr:hypothetical protein V496_08581 [Pseudogymnoascus sp. VKM F-4515 (FW-2607)]KFY83137.1 hypothetical protein V498_08279 [Pseudogymnoascus sp. VKM F-4517 (FW-2822)]
MSVPIAFKLSGPHDNDVIILTADMTLEDVQRTAYEAIRERVPQVYFDEFGGDMEKLGEVWVEWTTTNQSFPESTTITESNVAAVIKLLELRGGVDVLKGSLPSPPE